MDEVNDDIVEAVILQLKSTGNRPHLIKELSAILMHQLKSVQQYVFFLLFLFIVMRLLPTFFTLCPVLFVDSF